LEELEFISEFDAKGFKFVKLNGSLPATKLLLFDPKLLLEPNGSTFGAVLKFAVKLLPKGSAELPKSGFPKGSPSLFANGSFLAKLEFSYVFSTGANGSLIGSLLNGSDVDPPLLENGSDPNT